MLQFVQQNNCKKSGLAGSPRGLGRDGILDLVEVNTDGCSVGRRDSVPGLHFRATHGSSCWDTVPLTGQVLFCLGEARFLGRCERLGFCEFTPLRLSRNRKDGSKEDASQDSEKPVHHGRCF